MHWYAVDCTSKSAQPETAVSYKVDSRQAQTNTLDFHARVGWKAELGLLNFSKLLEISISERGYLIRLQMFNHLFFFPRPRSASVYDVLLNDLLGNFGIMVLLCGRLCYDISSCLVFSEAVESNLFFRIMQFWPLHSNILLRLGSKNLFNHKLQY